MYFALVLQVSFHNPWLLIFTMMSKMHNGLLSEWHFEIWYPHAEQENYNLILHYLSTYKLPKMEWRSTIAYICNTPIY
jgi:hypothetical protein